MIGLVAWCRAFQYDSKGDLVKNTDGTPSRIAYPLAGLWNYLYTQAKSLGNSFDLIQLPPASLAQGGTGAGVDGYEAFEYRNFNGTHWGQKSELQATIAALHFYGMLVWADLPFHQMGGENGGPGVFHYSGRRGETTASWFQGGFGNHDPIPPFVKQDDIPSLIGNFPFGRPRSYQNSIPQGVVEADTKDIIAYTRDTLDIDGARWDDVKATHVQSVARLVAAFPGLSWVGEFDSGNAADLNWWATSAPMNGMAAVADYSHYWNMQRACNHYDATQIDQHGAPYWQWRPDLCVGFANNPDVATTWGLNGEISQQTAFNLLSAYVIGMSLPFKAFMVYAEDYFTKSALFPTGRGFKPYIDNLAWISRTFAFGRFERRFVDKDVYCYTRDGNGGKVGWSGGLLVAVNFNTYTTRYIDVQTTWPEGTHIHDYSGHGQDLRVGVSGRCVFTVTNNAFSSGHGYVCYAPAGVNHPVAKITRATIQTFIGEKDLDIGNAVSLQSKQIGSIKLKAGAKAYFMLTADQTGWQELSELLIEVSLNGIDLLGIELRFNEKQATGNIQAIEDGNYMLMISTVKVPAAGSNYKLMVTYMGEPQ